MQLKRILKISIPFLMALLGGCGYGNYEECLLGEMKGQDQSMTSTAEKMCESKFPREKEIYSFRDGDWSIDWSRTSTNLIKIKVSSNETQYRITKVKMKFATVECSKAEGRDFNKVLSFKFSSADSASTYSKEAMAFKCMREDSVFGILEN